MSHTFPALPYAYDALEPYIDAKTMEVHYSKHHRTYYDKFVAAVSGNELEQQSLTEIFANISQPCRSQQWWRLLQPYLVLELHVSERRWRTDRRIWRCYQEHIRRFRDVPRSVRSIGNQYFWFRLYVVGGRRRTAEDHLNLKPRQPVDGYHRQQW